MPEDDVEIIVRRRRAEPEPKSLKVSQPRKDETKKEEPKQEPKQEGKTLFEHMGIGGGDGVFGQSMQVLKKAIMQFFYFVILGFILGLIMEMFYGFPAMVMALVFAVMWLIVVGKRFVFEQKK